mmetsp:Transcript_20874/g.63854  ORF Transcript_20874/g.63854 Transcript_20874/m.63854 type:complete len:291 (-) Transcript_20874:229-1101(-)
MTSIVGLELFLLCWGRHGEAGVDEPRALVVTNIGAHLADHGGVAVTIEVVILHLEVGAHEHADFAGLGKELLIRNASQEHCTSDRQVEGVKGRLVDDDVHVGVHREAREVNLVRLGGGEVEELTRGGLKSDLMEELHDWHIERIIPKVAAQHRVNVHLQKNAVIDGVHSDAVHLVPAQLAAPRFGGVHDVVSDQEVSLEPLDAPAECCGAPGELGRGGAPDGLHRLDHRDAAVELPLGYIIVDQPLDVRRNLWRKLWVLLLDLGDELGVQVIIDGKEILAHVARVLPLAR